MQGYSTWLEIDCSAVQNNIHQLQTITRRPVMAVIKANGYGHGLARMGQVARQAGALWLAVARLEEAAGLREAGLDLPILVLGYCDPSRVPEALRLGVTLAVHHPRVAQAFSDQAQAAGQVLLVHAKFDSGMGRLGVFTEEGMTFLRQVDSLPGLALDGMFTHMANADEPERDTTQWQLDRFTRLVQEAQSAGLRPRWVHAANSPSCLYFPAAYFDLVRPGIAIYGLHPSAEAPLPSGFRPALTWKTCLASVKVLPAGHGVGYNYRYVTRVEERIGVIPVGYADGFRRRLGNFALVGGQRVPVAGGVCMDQCMLQLDAAPSAQMGDEVVLLGRQGQAAISAEEIGAAWGTNNYDVVCGIEARVPRFYFD
jgi:alanine racemase